MELEEIENKGDGSTMAEQFAEDQFSRINKSRELAEAIESRREGIEYFILWHSGVNCIMEGMLRFADGTLMRLSSPVPGTMSVKVYDPSMVNGADDAFERYVAKLERNLMTAASNEAPQVVKSESAKIKTLKNLH